MGNFLRGGGDPVFLAPVGWGGQEEKKELCQKRGKWRRSLRLRVARRELGEAANEGAGGWW